jgi:hypothetical protein
MDDTGNSFAKMDQRVAALQLLSEWEGAPHTRHDMLAALLGYSEWNQLREAHYAEGVDGPLSRHFRGLLGPNGYAYYRALKARQEVDDGR